MVEIGFSTDVEQVNETEAGVFLFCRCLLGSVADQRGLSPSPWRYQDRINAVAKIGDQPLGFLDTVCEVIAISNGAECKRCLSHTITFISPTKVSYKYV